MVCSCGGNSERRLVGEVGGSHNSTGTSAISGNSAIGGNGSKGGAGALGGASSGGGSLAGSSGGTPDSSMQGGTANVAGQANQAGTSSTNNCNSTPSNLITNGDFCDGSNHWNVTYSGSYASDYSTNISAGTFCVQSNTTIYAALTLGWPTSTETGVALESGSSYTFSYSAGGASLMIVAKVGLTVSPWTAAYSGIESLGTAMTDFSHTFTASNVLGPVGVAFTISDPSATSYFYYPGQICFDNVSLVKN